MKNNINKTITKKISWWQKIILVLLGVFFVLLTLEIGLRVGGFVSRSLLEYRNLQSIKKNGEYRIMCLGESTTQNQYPAPLEKILNQRNVGVRFSVIDKGVVGADTTTILGRVESYLDEYHPDMVMTMMGCNDRRIMYYQDIPGSDTGPFRHCRVYKFGRILYMLISQKVKQEGIYRLNKAESDPKQKLENAGVVVEKINLLNEASADKATKVDPRDQRSPTVRNDLNQNPFPEVEESFKKAVERNFKNDHDYVELWWLYRGQGKFSEAEAAFKKAIEINPGNDNAYVELGRLYRDQGKFSETEAAFRKALEINPANDFAYVQLGLLQRDQGRFFPAEDAFTEAIKINSKNDSAYLELGRIYRDRGKLSEAEAAFKKTIEINPRNDFAYFKLGRLYRKQGKFSQSEDSFKKSIELNPKNYFACVELGRLYQDHGKFSQAEDAFKKVIESDPENDNAHRAILVLYEAIGKPELAKEYIEKAHRLGLWQCTPATVNNYRKLKKILDKRGIRLVCVQYPMRSVGPLKQIFEENEGVIFVDNESIFKKALKEEGSQEYFVDMFGGDFGHCTGKGNSLLAQNIADVILKEIFHKQ